MLVDCTHITPSLLSYTMLENIDNSIVKRNIVIFHCINIFLTPLIHTVSSVYFSSRTQIYPVFILLGSSSSSDMRVHSHLCNLIECGIFSGLTFSPIYPALLNVIFHHVSDQLQLGPYGSYHDLQLCFYHQPTA